MNGGRVRDGQDGRPRRWWNRLTPSLLGWLLVVWLMLWGTVDLRTAVFGIMAAVLVLALYPLPHVRSRFFARPPRLAALVGYVALDLLLSAVRLAWDVLWRGRNVTAAIVAVPVLSDTDQVIVSAANLISLAPGTFVLQLDREGAIFYVYSLGPRSRGEADRICDEVVKLQVRVIRAFGSAEEIRRLPETVERVRRCAGERKGRTP